MYITGALVAFDHEVYTIFEAMGLWDATLAGLSNLENTMYFVVQSISCRPS